MYRDIISCLGDTLLDRVILLGIGIIVVIVIVAATIWFRYESVSTCSTCNPLQIVNAEFIRVVNGDKMNITLSLKIKNTGSSPIILTAVKIPGVNTTKRLDKLIDPGQILAFSIIVYSGKYLPNWDQGTEHIVILIYKVQGQATSQAMPTYMRAPVI